MPISNTVKHTGGVIANFALINIFSATTTNCVNCVNYPMEVGCEHIMLLPTATIKVIHGHDRKTIVFAPKAMSENSLNVTHVHWAISERLLRIHIRAPSVRSILLQTRRVP